MRTIGGIAVAAMVAMAPLQSQAGVLGAITAGGIVGGLAGSAYASGPSVTMASVGSAVTGAAAAVPSAATGAAAAIAATSTPVLFGVAVGGTAAYLLYSLAH